MKYNGFCSESFLLVVATGTRAFTSEGSHLGKQTFFEKVHPLVITNFYSSNNKISTSAASIFLAGSSEELVIISNCSSDNRVGPLLVHLFRQRFIADGIETLVRIGIPDNAAIFLWWNYLFFGRNLILFIIGVLVGGNFAVKQMFPLLRILVIISCID